MKVAMLGGSFDPIHTGHLFVADEVLNQFNFDRILFVPAKRAPHRADGPGPRVTDAHRAEMVRLADWVMDMSIVSVTFVGDGTSLLSCLFDNLSLGTAFEWREIGIYADDPDVGEILYAYTNAGDNYDIVPAYGGATLAEYEPDIYTKIGTITDVSAVTVPPSDLVSLATYNAHIADKSAHGNQWTLVNTNYTASKGEKMMVDTSSAAREVTLPSNPAADDWVGFADYAKTFDVNKLTVKRAGSGEKIQGLNEDMDVDAMGASFSMVYIDATKGWVISLV